MASLESCSIIRIPLIGILTCLELSLKGKGAVSKKPALYHKPKRGDEILSRQ